MIDLRYERRLVVTPAGTAAGMVRSGRGEVHVSAGQDGVLAERLVHQGEPADARNPLARLYPEGSA